MTFEEKPVIFLVDDDEDDRFLFEQFLRLQFPRYIVKHFNKGEELLPALEQTQPLPHLVLLDIRLRGMDGFETLRQVRQQRRYHELPVVLITGYDRVDNKQLAAQYEASDYLTKPSTVERYLAVMRQLQRNWFKGVSVESANT